MNVLAKCVANLISCPLPLLRQSKPTRLIHSHTKQQRFVVFTLISLCPGIYRGMCIAWLHGVQFSLLFFKMGPLSFWNCNWISMGCFIYSQLGSSSRSNWTGLWTGNSNGSWTDKQPSHFSTVKEMSVKATFFFL